MRQRLRSFYYAYKGILLATREPNFRIQLVVAILVIAMGFWFEVTSMEWCVLLICIGAVLSAEILNSSIETLTDAIFQDQDKRAARIKDLAAGAVLVLAVISTVVGVIIFGPRLWALL